MDEIWKPVASREGVQASNYGRVLLPERESPMPKGGWRKYKPKPTYGSRMKAARTARHVYMGLYNKFYGTMKVHRLVCEAFHGAVPFDGAVVIHLDEDATNNRPDNLKWGTQKENLNMPKFLEYCRSRTGENSPTTKGRRRKIES
jgi:hypothetical protein